MDTFVELVIGGLSLGLFYTLMAVPLVMIYKTTKVFNLGHGGLVLLGAYIFYLFYVQLQLPRALAGLLSAAVACMAAYIIKRIMLDPVIGQPILSLIMMTLVLWVVLEKMVVSIWGDATLRYDPPVLPGGSMALGTFSITLERISIAGLVAVTILVVGVFFARSKTGLQMTATAEDHTIAQSLGINVRRVFAIAWMVSMLMAIVAGVIAGSLMGLSSWIPLVALRAFAVVLLGGIESMGGALVAGLIIGLTETMAAFYLGGHVSGIGGVAPFVIILLVMLFRPYGLFGWVRIERV